MRMTKDRPMVGNCGCGRAWQGLAEAHCRICHRHFSTVANFDRHRPSYDGCGDPAELRDKAGRTLLKAAEGPRGTTWVGAREYGGPRRAARPGKGIPA